MSNQIRDMAAWVALGQTDAPPEDVEAAKIACGMVAPPAPRPEPTKTCRADACTAEVNPALIFCTRHWAKVPKAMQTAIWQTYTPGQEYVTTPTPEHLDAVRSAVRIIAESEAPRLL